MKKSRELVFGEVVYIAIIYHVTDSWIFLLNGYDFYFDHMTGENREYTQLKSSCEIKTKEKQARSGLKPMTSAIQEVIGRIPLRPTFFSGLIDNCLSCVYNCDDEWYLHIFLRSSNIWSFVYSLKILICHLNNITRYSGTPLYGHPVITDSLAFPDQKLIHFFKK